ncbi:MAG: WYL domain-containing protein [Acutalibacteraceae bacterium]|nr:WYL domain-containing protein [Acutalibacteraceae bacterium]
MSGGRNQRKRILTLLDILMCKTDEEHPLNATELISLLELNGITCDRKTIYDDIEALCLCGYDIVSTKGGKSGYFLTGRDFELPEVALLTDAVLSADFITRKKTNTLVNKLKGLLNEYQAKSYSGRTFIDNRNKGDNEEIYYSIDAIERGIGTGKKIALKYIRHELKDGHNPSPTAKEMKVSPYALIWADDHYYLVCNNEKYDNLMHLRLDRMKKVTVINENYRHFSEVSEYKTEFNTADYSAKVFNMFSGTEEEIVLDCSNDILEQVIDRFSDKIFIRQKDPSRFLFSHKAYISDGLVTWIMQFGSKMRVESPDSLKEKIVLRAKEIETLYK